MFTPLQKPEIIAEIGTAHQGSLKTAKRLIRAARRAGADTVKTQVVFAREIIHPRTGMVPLPGGDTPLYEVFDRLEQPLSFFRDLRDICRAEGVGFLASPFGHDSLALLNELDCRRIKIASPELNWPRLLEGAASGGREVIVSTGVALPTDIREALRHLGPSVSRKVTLLHGITSYPAPEEEYNVGVLDYFRGEFNTSAGISDHSLDPALVPSLAMLKGAVIIEKHLCLSHEEGGLDDPIALDPDQFRQMSNALNELIGLTDADARNRLNTAFGTDRVRAVLGLEGPAARKHLAPAERANYGRTNRSIHALKDLSAGMVLSGSNTAVLRTEKILRPGLEPRLLPCIIGKKLIRDVPAGEGITWDDLLPPS